MANEDIRRYSTAELRKRRDAGGTETRADAPERELDEEFWENATIVFPAAQGKVSKTIRYDHDVLAWFQATGKGWQTRMNAVLRGYVEAQKRKAHSAARKK